MRAYACSSSKSLSPSCLVEHQLSTLQLQVSLTRYTRVEYRVNHHQVGGLAVAFRACRMSDSSLLISASFFFPLMCFWDLMYSIELFLVASFSRQVRQNNLLLLTVNCSSG